MRFASYAPLMLLAALGCAAACSGDDDDDSANTAGKSSTAGKNSGGSSSQAGSPAKGGEASDGGAGTTEPEDSQLCTALGGPANIDAVVRGDGKTSKTDPFNGFKFEKDGRKGSVLLNVATDPCIGQQFAHLLAADKADDLEHLAECLSLFVQNAAGCAVPYVGAKDKAGRACLSMKGAHIGLGITEQDYTALVTDAAQALIDAGVDPASAQFKAVAGALTDDALKADVITSEDAMFSQAGEMCEAAAGGAGGAGGAAAGGAGGAQ